MQMRIITRLISQGWIPLRQLGALLNLPTRSIYGRQRTKNPVSTIRIGGHERVYTDVVIHELENATRLDKSESLTLLSVLNTGLRRKEREEKKNA